MEADGETNLLDWWRQHKANFQQVASLGKEIIVHPRHKCFIRAGFHHKWEHYHLLQISTKTRDGGPARFACSQPVIAFDWEEHPWGKSIVIITVINTSRKVFSSQHVKWVGMVHQIECFMFTSWQREIEAGYMTTRHIAEKKFILTSLYKFLCAGIFISYWLTEARLVFHTC